MRWRAPMRYWRYPAASLAQTMKQSSARQMPRRLPTIFHARTGSTADALASYGANDAEIARQAARFVDKILKGIKAGDIPVERPTKLEFVINLKTAKQIGLTIPVTCCRGRTGSFGEERQRAKRQVKEIGQNK